MKRILVPTDFSEQAGHALDFAIQIAEKGNSEIFLVNVVDYPGLYTAWGGGLNVIGGAEPPFDSLDETYISNMLERAREEIETAIKDKNNDQVRIHKIVEVGNPYYVINEMIEKENINLVIMGSKGASGMEEVLIGSNTEKVVRHSKCPVITIKKRRDLSHIKKIAFASNFEGDQSYVVEELKKLQSILKASIHLVKINTPNNFDNTRTINRQMIDFVSQYGIKNYEMHIYNDFMEEEGIVYFAQDIEADMIALATHGRTGILHLLSGSIAEDVVNHAKRPVWTCRIKV